MKAKTVLITGCSDGGIGSDLSRCFATRGFKVIATARSRSKMSALETVPNVILLELNICSSNSIAAALEAVLIETGGTLDLLVNNAGVSYRSAALEVDDRMARELFDAKGTIVNVSSLGGIGVPMLWSSIYAASKAAVDTYSNTLRLELSPFGVRVVTIVAGAVETVMNNPDAFAPSTLPTEGSIFKPVEKHIAQGTIPERMPVGKFADKVVGDILSGATGRVLRGAFASRIWAIMTFCPRAVLDKLVTYNQGLDLLDNMYDTQAKSSI